MNSITLSEYVKSGLITRNIAAQEQYQCIVWDSTLPEYIERDQQKNVVSSAVESVSDENLSRRIKQQLLQHDIVLVVLTITPLVSIKPALAYAQKQGKTLTVLHTFGGVGGRIVGGSQDTSLLSLCVEQSRPVHVPYDTLSLFSQCRQCAERTGVECIVLQPGEYPSSLPLGIEEGEQYSLHTLGAKSSPSNVLYVAGRITVDMVEIVQLLNQTYNGTIALITGTSPFPVFDEETLRLLQGVGQLHCFYDTGEQDYADAMRNHIEVLGQVTPALNTFFSQHVLQTYTPLNSSVTTHHADYLYELHNRGKEALAMGLANLANISLTSAE